MWRELQVVVPRGLAESASAQLLAAGAAGVQEDYLPGEAPPPRQPWDTGAPPPQPKRLLLRAWWEDPDERALRGLAERLSVEGVAPAWVDVPDQDWDTAWQQHFETLTFGPLVIAPPWEEVPGALIIEPGQGFGTGQHPTTRAALQAVVDLKDQVRTVLDIGCGSGILALAAAHLGLEASGVDNDPVAVRDADAQAARNGLSVPFATTPVEDLREPADLVLANLFAEVLAELADPLIRLTGKHLVLAGILLDREHTVRAAFDPRMRLAHRVVDGEWVSLRYEPLG